ncbi:MAG: hypothetical protein ACJAXU_000766, partial [Paracoccaceae bacterium]
MAIIYIYQASDFSSGLPDESHGAARGRPPFELTLNADCKPIAVEINDDDNDFDELDSTQCLTNDITINGVEYSAGDNILSAYHLSDSGGDHVVTSFHIGDGINGYTSGAVQGVVSTEPLVAGQSYSFNCEQTAYGREMEYSKSVACFTKGTPIDTPYGSRPIEQLQVGDQVVVADGAPEQISWVGHSQVVATGNFAPVVFAKGAIGNPHELSVSPQHRMLVRHWACEVLFGAVDVLVPAIHLLNGASIWQSAGGSVEYYHLMFQAHEIVFSNGVPSESFHAST